MCDYTPSEIVDMISIPGECQKDYRVNAWLRRERFPNRRLREEICNDNVVDSTHDRSSTRNNFFKFWYQHTTLKSVGKYCKKQSWHVTCYTSDETTFKNSGLLNRYSSNYWVDETPHWQRSVDCRHQWSLNVWCGVVKGHLVNLNYLMKH